uniref:YgjP-like metallopeptidase domain-containing protein n=1 Tax=uncultured bacterium 5H7 TaxID=1701327 RepID=A0A0N9HHD4_9BACT|nr:hypothetical protein 5H7_042 [uncultured bacterium 5H7]
MRLPDWLRPGAGHDSEPTITIGEHTLPLVIRRLPRARRLTLRLAPDGAEVRVSAPRSARSAEVVAFAGAHVDWLAGQLAKVPPRRAIGPGSQLAFRGAALIVRHDPAAPRRPLPENGAICLGGSAESVPQRLRRWLEREARRILAEDLAHYCREAGVAVPALSLSNARRRWGSCSARRTIRVNWRLIMAPDAVRRSVVAHEVAHLVHFDHGPGFHALLRTLFEGDLAAANLWLKRHGQGLYAPFG